jgi:hypothetical protein
MGANLAIYDVLGNKVANYSLSPLLNSVTEDISNLLPGFYVYCILTSDQIVQRGKIIIAR